MTRRSASVIAAILVLAAAGLGCSAEESELTVFAASSLSGHLEEAMTPEGSGPTVTWQFAGSQALLEQIRQGAAPDIVVLAEPSIDAPRFVPTPAASAADDNRELRPVVLVRNRLAVVTPPGNPRTVTGLADLDRHELRVAICAPAVPCGASTAAIASRLQIAIAADTMESSVRSVLAKVVAQEVDAAVVYASDAVFAGDQVEVVETISTASGYAAWKLTSGDPDVDAWFERLTSDGVDGLVALGFPRFP